MVFFCHHVYEFVHAQTYFKWNVKVLNILHLEICILSQWIVISNFVLFTKNIIIVTVLAFCEKSQYLYIHNKNNNIDSVSVCYLWSLLDIWMVFFFSYCSDNDLWFRPFFPRYSYIDIMLFTLSNHCKWYILYWKFCMISLMQWNGYL